jgi:hypothetical protein
VQQTVALRGDGFSQSEQLSVSKAGRYPNAECTATLVIEFSVTSRETMTGTLNTFNRYTDDPYWTSFNGPQIDLSILQSTGGPVHVDGIKFDTTLGLPQSQSMPLYPGNVYQARISGAVHAYNDEDEDSGQSFSVDTTFTNMVTAPGALQWGPLVPGPGGSFHQVPHGWMDPSMAEGYTFTATGDGLFKNILAFPDGIAGTYYVATEGVTYGPFAPSESVDFQNLRGHGVSSFVLTGIQPFVDATSQMAFPIMLDFTTPAMDFTMIPVAAPDCQMETLANGDLQFTFTGVLQSSPDLMNWTDVTPAPASPYVLPKASVGGAKFFRSRDP